MSLTQSARSAAERPRGATATRASVRKNSRRVDIGVSQEPDVLWIDLQFSQTNRFPVCEHPACCRIHFFETIRVKNPQHPPWMYEGRQRFGCGSPPEWFAADSK